MDVLSAGAAPVLFDQVRAPSAIGTWLRAFTWSNIRQFDAVTRQTLVRAWAAGLGPTDLAASLIIDIDSSVCQTYGINKQGAKFGYTKVRGYHPLLATLADTGEVVHSRMRGGNAASARGAKTFTAETLSRVRAAGATGELTVRADSAFYSRHFVGACRAADARFSVTVRQDTAIRAAIDAIPEAAWTPIPYWMDGGADVAETTYTAFKSNKPDAVEVRLIVRRVRPHPRFATGAGRGVRPSRRWSPTATATPSRWRPTTALTPASSWSSATSKTGRWRTCRQASSPPTPPGWAWPCWPTTWAATR
ncbi:MAG: transposase [Euzebyaceae bacterium]|nr:transposase [Euzebyaceae bacterium]